MRDIGRRVTGLAKGEIVVNQPLESIASEVADFTQGPPLSFPSNYAYYRISVSNMIANVC